MPAVCSLAEGRRAAASVHQWLSLQTVNGETWVPHWDLSGLLGLKASKGNTCWWEQEVGKGGTC